MFLFYDWPFPHVYFAENVGLAYFHFNSWLSFQRLCRLLWGLFLSWAAAVTGKSTLGVERQRVSKGVKRTAAAVHVKRNNDPAMPPSDAEQLSVPAGDKSSEKNYTPDLFAGAHVTELLAENAALKNKVRSIFAPSVDGWISCQLFDFPCTGMCWCNIFSLSSHTALKWNAAISGFTRQRGSTNWVKWENKLFFDCQLS